MLCHYQAFIVFDISYLQLSDVIHRLFVLVYDISDDVLKARFYLLDGCNP